MIKRRKRRKEVKELEWGKKKRKGDKIEYFQEETLFKLSPLFKNLPSRKNAKQHLTMPNHCSIM